MINEKDYRILPIPYDGKVSVFDVFRIDCELTDVLERGNEKLPKSIKVPDNIMACSGDSIVAEKIWLPIIEYHVYLTQKGDIVIPVEENDASGLAWLNDYDC